MKGSAKRVLVTGGAGFIGSHIVDAYVQHGYEVTVVDDLSTGRRENLNPKARFIHGDLREDATLGAIRKLDFDLLNHQAAQTDLGRSVKDPAFDEAINVRASLRLLQIAVDLGIPRVVFASSGGGVYGEPDFVPQTEDHPTKAPTPYGAAKLLIDQYLEYLRKARKLSSISLRYANVYGPRQRGDGEAGVVAIFLWQILNGRELTINGPGTQTRDYVYVEDVVRANLAVSESDLQGPFNVGTERETSVNELAERIERVSGRTAKKVWREGAFSGQSRSVLDGRRLRAAASLADPMRLEEGLSRTAAWFSAAAATDAASAPGGAGRRFS